MTSALLSEILPQIVEGIEVLTIFKQTSSRGNDYPEGSTTNQSYFALSQTNTSVVLKSRVGFLAFRDYEDMQIFRDTLVGTA